MRHFSRLLLVLVVLANNIGHATTDAPAAFGFGPPKVMKLDWSTRALTPADLDGDGLQDLAVINNDAGKIELLYQLPQGEAAREQKKSLNRGRWEPVLEDALFEQRGLTIGFPVFDMVVHDLNGDGRPDLAYTSGQVPLTVRYQSEDGDWVDSSEYDGFQALGWMQSIQAADIDGDGSVELVVLSADATRVFRHAPDSTLNEPEIYYTSGENPFNLMVFDVTGDGLSDLLYLSTDGKQVLAMREQIEGGRFGPERRHVMERPARIVMPILPTSSGPGSLGVVDSRSGSLEFMRLATPVAGERAAGSALEAGTPEIYPIFKQVRESASYALGDVNGDGEQDLIVANPAAAKLVLFSKKNGRFQALQEFPSFSAVSSLTAGRFHAAQRESVIVLSEAEKNLGLSELDPGGRLTFPQQIKIGSHEPVVTAAVDLDGDGFDELLLVTQDQGNYRLLVAAPAGRERVEGPWEMLFELELAGVRRQPTAIASLDVFAADGRPGVIIYVPREPPVLLGPVASEAGVALQQVAKESSIRENLLKALRPAETSTFDVDGDGLNELVVARTGFARAFKLVEDQLEMVDQFNARSGSDVIDAVIPLSAGAEVNRIALYVAADRELQFLQRGADGVFRYQVSTKVGRLDLQNWYPLSATDNGPGKAYLFAGEDRFWYFNGTASASWEVEKIYETDLEDIHYTHLAGADFNQDQVPDFVALDGSEHVVDILSVAAGELRSRMFWQVFEQNMHYQGRTGANLEPREIVIDDFTGDRLPDLVLLVHDRILVYPQK